MASIGGFFRALKAIWELGDELAPLLEQLPGHLATAGQGMAAGGVGAIQAGYALNGGDGAVVNARQMVDAVATAVAECYNQLDHVASQLEATGGKINQVAIPVIVPKTTSLLGVQVVIGFEPEVSRPFDLVNDQFELAATTLRGAGSALNTAAGSLRKLRDTLQDAGQELNALGSALKSGGEALQDIGS